MDSTILGRPIAQGRTAEVYAWREHQVLKLFHAWCPSSWIEHEVEIGRRITTLALPTPRVLDTVEIEGRSGIVYERVNGDSLTQLVRSKPWRVVHFARQFADLHAQIHHHGVTGLPSLRAALIHDIHEVESLPVQLKDAVLTVAERMPDHESLCHFDFHPEQVLMTMSGPVIIDWTTARQGDPLADVARTSVILRLGRLPYGGWMTRMITDLWRQTFHRTYLARYFASHPGLSQAQFHQWVAPVAAARLYERIPGEEEKLLQLIRTTLESSE